MSQASAKLEGLDSAVKAYEKECETLHGQAPTSKQLTEKAIAARDELGLEIKIDKAWLWRWRKRYAGPAPKEVGHIFVLMDIWTPFSGTSFLLML
jgi:hypothetical protein